LKVGTQDKLEPRGKGGVFKANQLGNNDRIQGSYDFSPRYLGHLKGEDHENEPMRKCSSCGTVRKKKELSKTQ